MDSKREGENLDAMNAKARDRLGAEFPGVARMRWGAQDQTVEVTLNVDPAQTQIIQVSLGHENNTRSCYDAAIVSEVLEKLQPPTH